MCRCRALIASEARHAAPEPLKAPPHRNRRLILNVIHWGNKVRDPLKTQSSIPAIATDPASIPITRRQECRDDFQDNIEDAVLASRRHAGQSLAQSSFGAVLHRWCNMRFPWTLFTLRATQETTTKSLMVVIMTRSVSLVRVRVNCMTAVRGQTDQPRTPPVLLNRRSLRSPLALSR